MTPALETIRTVATLRRRVAAWRTDGSVGLVPTMGAIHDGHLALVAAARARCAHAVASLFVNPTQFGPNEDFAAYPRDEAGDAAKLAAAGCDALFAPDADEMYPEGFATSVTVAGLTDRLCGLYRPGHFAGVATVVTKLLNQAQPDAAFFGEKDYQQLQVIRRLARDLDMPVEIVGVPTLRAPDGLALSSRNAYLGAAEREAAPALYRTLSSMAEHLSDDTTRAPDEIARGKDALLAAGFTRIDYLSVCDAETLDDVETVVRPARVLAAAWLGPTRLIDNVPVSPR